MYLIGEVVGALFFGRLTDKLGRKKLFIITLAIYLVGSGLGGFAWDYWSLLICRFIAGTGIGGEYTAINSAIDELIPSQYRGRVDIAVNGTYWGGAAIGSAHRPVPVLQPRPDQLGLAHRLLHRPGARPDHHLPPAHDPGEPALADDPRPQRRGRTHGRRDRGAGQARRRRAQAGRRQQGDRGHRTPAARLLRADQDLLRHVPEALDLRVHDDGDAGLPLQRDLLQLRAGAEGLLPRAGRAASRTTSSRSRSATCSARCCSATCSTSSAGAR